MKISRQFARRGCEIVARISCFRRVFDRSAAYHFPRPIHSWHGLHKRVKLVANKSARVDACSVKRATISVCIVETPLLADYPFHRMEWISRAMTNRRLFDSCIDRNPPREFGKLIITFSLECRFCENFNILNFPFFFFNFNSDRVQFIDVVNVISCTLTSNGNASNFSVSPCERTWYHARHSYELSISKYPLLSNPLKIIISETKKNNFNVNFTLLKNS